MIVLNLEVLINIYLIWFDLIWKFSIIMWWTIEYCLFVWFICYRNNNQMSISILNKSIWKFSQIPKKMKWPLEETIFELAALNKNRICFNYEKISTREYNVIFLCGKDFRSNFSWIFSYSSYCQSFWDFTLIFQNLAKYLNFSRSF